MHQLEEFKQYFARTTLYLELNQQYTEYEIFEITQGKFEISEVQAAFEKWAKQSATDHKRAEFAKNLNHLISGNYILVRKTI
ncbi:hypothetical protein C3F34_14720 [Acinetobacter sp. ACNIH2]|uniref:hypothetical protein n=1 Tax=Acinetobacter sp. ACNIH2 TaxID=1758189 RepID=UPI000CDC9E24|nr:hypothetical protein [Acinetobacter sp. ACNIH2]AUX87163.1 hypothetical protein C3F34_14720 [Acinetobacter sp. ACNIH2]